MDNNIYQWYYRGSLKSCNYKCSYCPFSKNPESSKEELKKDEECLVKFVSYLTDRIAAGNGKCAVQIVPYGEALVHGYYWRELARLSSNPGIEACGAQTNLSFDIDKMTGIFLKNNGDLKKARLWCTFHPQMVTAGRFISQCKKLSEYGILYCAGVVGEPSHINGIRYLRERLPDDVYLFINKMDGLKRRYTQEEIQAFSEIDEYFETGLRHHKADINKCRGICFVEADNTKKRCNICLPGKDGIICTRKECSCYLSYCNQSVPELIFFNPYPAFRIPHYPEAVFFDIDGTLINPGDKVIPGKTAGWLEKLASHSRLFLVTSRPYNNAMAKLSRVKGLLSGGVFAHGGMCRINIKPDKTSAGKKIYEKIFPLEYPGTAFLKENASKYGYKVYIYSKKGKSGNNVNIYKITLSFNRHKDIRQSGMDGHLKSVADKLGLTGKDLNIIYGDGCIQVIGSNAGKKEGVSWICSKMGYKDNEIAVFGNSYNDIPMLKGYGFSVAVNADAETRQAAKYSLTT